MYIKMHYRYTSPNEEIRRVYNLELLHVIPPGSVFTKEQADLDDTYPGRRKPLTVTRIIGRKANGSVVIVPLSHRTKIENLTESGWLNQ